MSTHFFSTRLAAVVAAAGAMLTMVSVSGCITHPPDTTHKNDRSKALITHPPDYSKDGPPHKRHHRHRKPPVETSPAPTPAPITHPGE